MALPTASDNVFPKVILAEGAAPATPSSGQVKLYAKADGLLYSKDDAGAETALGAGLANPMTTSQDIIVGGASGTPGRLAKGSDGQVLTVDPTTHNLVWATPSSGFSDPMTTRGDIIYRNSGNTTARLGRGSASQVLTSDGTDIAWATPAGGGSRPYIDTVTLHATHGDDFTGALNTSLWTRRTVTSGEETANVAGSDGWMRVDFSNAAASRLYLQTAPAGDFEVILSFAQYASSTGNMVGPVIIDSSGAGMAAFIYDSSLAAYLGVLSGYAYSSFPTTISYDTANYRNMGPMWLGLRKVGTTYSMRYSQNGYEWSPYSSGSTSGITVDRIGFGRILGTPTTHRVTVDRFNVI